MIPAGDKLSMGLKGDGLHFNTEDTEAQRSTEMEML